MSNTADPQTYNQAARNRVRHQSSTPTAATPPTVSQHTRILESHDYYGISEVFCWIYGVSLALMIWQASEDRFITLRIGRWYFGHIIYMILLFPSLLGFRYHLAFLSLRTGATFAPGVDLNALPRERAYAIAVFVLGIVATLANLCFAILTTILLLSTECATQVWCNQHMWNVVLICLLAYFMAILAFGHVVFTLMRKITPLFLHTDAHFVEVARKHYS